MHEPRGNGSEPRIAFSAYRGAIDPVQLCRTTFVVGVYTIRRAGEWAVLGEALRTNMNLSFVAASVETEAG